MFFIMSIIIKQTVFRKAYFFFHITFFHPMSLFGGLNRKSYGAGTSSSCKLRNCCFSRLAVVEEVASYASFMKQYREEMNSILGKLSDSPDSPSFHSVSFGVFSFKHIETICECKVSIIQSRFILQ